MRNFLSFLRGKNSQKGQAILIVVLVMVVFLTIGLSVVSRSIVNVRTANDEERSQRAFSAAEAGIEQALKLNSNGNNILGIPQTVNTSDSSTKIQNVNVTTIGGPQVILNNANQILKDDGYDIWLSDFPNFTSPVGNPNRNYTITLYWGDPALSACNNAAMEIILLYGATKNTALTHRYGVDPCPSRSGNGFTQNPATGGTLSPTGQNAKRFAYAYTLPVITNGFLIRVSPLYSSSSLGVLSNVDLPVQGKQIDSTGVSGSTSRHVTLFQGYPSLPSEFFPYILFSK